MSPNPVKSLDDGIRRLIMPTLVGRGFSFEPPSRTFRRLDGNFAQIVDFQIGTRTMAGHFTVNLGVFHSEYHEPASSVVLPEHACNADCLMDFRCRLSVLRSTPFTRLFRNRVRSTESFLKWWLVTPTDKWWPLMADDSQVAAQLSSVSELLLCQGLDWLNRNSDITLLKEAHDKIVARQNIAKQPR